MQYCLHITYTLTLRASNNDIIYFLYREFKTIYDVVTVVGTHLNRNLNLIKKFLS